MKKKLILIGGVPGVGKTTVAYELALKLKIEHVINVDIVKAFTRAYREDFKDSENIYTTTHEAYKKWGIMGFINHAIAINSIIYKIIDNMKDKVIIIEGATISREFVDKLDKDKYQIVYINLYIDKDKLEKRYKERIKIRDGMWLENIREIERINEYLLKDNFNIKNDNLNETIERIIEYVKEVLCI